LAGDRGLCGSFNSTIIRMCEQFIKEKEAQGLEVTLNCIGKKGYEHFKSKRTIETYHEDVLARADYGQIGEITKEIIDQYLEGKYDAIYLIYNEFKSAISQKAVVEKLVPISTEIPEGVVGIRHKSEEGKLVDYLMEPSVDALLKAVVSRHFQTQLFRAVLESLASEHGARMSAMDNATNNANDMIERLTLEYNKARQAAITTELMEIIGGMEAV